MSAITWDATGTHLYETGVDHGVLYLWDTATSTFKDGVAWNGLTAVNESPSGAEPSAIYADNIKYLNLMSAEEYGCTIEAYTYPDEFTLCDGSAVVADGVTIGQQPRKLFGFCYRTLTGSDTEGTSKGYKLNIVYNCTASPSERNHTTVNDSPEAASLSWTISTTPVDVTGFKPTATLVVDSTKCPEDKLKDLEDVLYGTALTNPRLPFPAEVIALVGNSGSEPGITITPGAATIAVGETFRLSSEVVPVGTVVTWTSSDTTKATVSSYGVVEGKGVTSEDVTITATITVDSETYTDTCTVTVVAAE